MHRELAVVECRLARLRREIVRVAEGGDFERAGRGLGCGDGRLDLAPAVRDAHTLRDAGTGGLSGG